MRPRFLHFLLALAACAVGHLQAQVSPLWTDATPDSLDQPQNGETAITSIDFGNGTFVAAGFEASFVIGLPTLYFTFTSPDGVTWTRHDGAPTGGRIRFADGSFLLASRPNPDSFLYASPDGVHWTRTANLGRGAQGIVDLASGNGVTVLGRNLDDPYNDSPLPIVSADLIHWSAHTVGPTTESTNLPQVAFVNDRFILLGQSYFRPVSYTSANGADWSAATPPVSPFSGSSWITAGNGVALLPRSYHDLQVSADGMDWSVASPGVLFPNIYGASNTIPLLYARFINGRFVGAANNYDQKTFNVYTSTDAQHWTRFGAVPGRYAVNDLAFGNDVYVATTDRGIFRVAAKTVDPALTGKACQLVGAINEVAAKRKTQKSKQVISGTFTLTNTGRQAAQNVQVSVFLSDDRKLDPSGDVPGDVYLGTLSLADLGHPKIGGNGKSTGAMPFKFHAATYNVPSTSGKYLLLVVDPQRFLNEGDRTGDLVVYGPLP